MTVCLPVCSPPRAWIQHRRRHWQPTYPRRQQHLYYQDHRRRRCPEGRTAADRRPPARCTTTNAFNVLLKHASHASRRLPTLKTKGNTSHLVLDNCRIVSRISLTCRAFYSWLCFFSFSSHSCSCEITLCDPRWINKKKDANFQIPRGR